MGAGMYGLNGIHLRTSLKMYNSFLLPRLFYGLKVLSMNKGDLEALDMYHRGMLKHLQNLPDGTATCAVYLITGMLPASAIWARNVLTF